MSRKYIGQVNDYNFVYPNNLLYEYDVEIVHDINNNCVSGDVTNFVVTSVNSTGMTISYDLTFIRNNAELFRMGNGNYSLVSAHILPAGLLYYKPWVMIDNYTVTGMTGNTVQLSGTTTVTNTQAGVSSFGNGAYVFELRFIGHRCVYNVDVNVTLTPVAVTPTPTATHTPTPTPTPSTTPSNTTPTPTPTPSPTIGTQTMQFAFSPDPSYTGRCQLYKSTDGGATYEQINEWTGVGSVTITPTPNAYYYITTTKTGGSTGSGRYAQSVWDVDGISNINVATSQLNPSSVDSDPFQVAASGTHHYVLHGYISNLL